MTRSLLTICFALIIVACSHHGRTGKEVKYPVVDGTAEFDIQEEFHNFGNLKAGEVVSYTFVFKNKGKETLVINRIEADCDCIELGIPKKTVEPEEEGHIIVIYNSAGEVGRQLKNIVITSNAPQKEIHLYIRANVVNEIIELHS